MVIVRVWPGLKHRDNRAWTSEGSIERGVVDPGCLHVYAGFDGS
jgi:hypothetical protein